MTKYTFSTDAGPKDWIGLPRQMKAGETIFRWNGHDYGCTRDDMMLGGFETISCSLEEGQFPFFTVPVTLLLDEAGKQPRGEYMRISN